jgi:hypothetical protein
VGVRGGEESEEGVLDRRCWHGEEGRGDGCGSNGD